MTQENFDKIIEEFKKLNKLELSAKSDTDYLLDDKLELIKLGVDYDPFPWITYYKYIPNIISMLDSINKDWCRKYWEDKTNFPNEGSKFPLIFVDFKYYVEKLMDEKYEECVIIKEKILSLY